MRRAMTWGWVLIAVVALLAGCALLAERREAAARDAHPPVGRLIDLNGTRVHAWVEGSGPDVVLIHGASGNLRDFTFSLAGRLADEFRVIAFDRPGLGWTERLPGHGGPGSSRGESPAEQAALLQAAADRIGVENPVVVGHSYGAAVALAWGLARPGRTRALVSLAGAAMPWPGGLGALYAINGSALGGATVVPLITAFAPEAAVDDAVASVFAPQHPPRGYAEHMGVGLSLRREALRANAQQVESLRPHIVEMSARYAGTLTMPVEIVHGTADTIVPMDIHSEPLSQLLPDARLTRLAGVGHMPHHVDEDAVIAAIRRAAGTERD